jgi:hypothetical protein
MPAEEVLLNVAVMDQKEFKEEMKCDIEATGKPFK